MSDQQINRYLEWLSEEISTMYNITKSDADTIVQNSPMRDVITAEPEYTMHMPLQHWAELVYTNR